MSTNECHLNSKSNYTKLIIANRKKNGTYLLIRVRPNLKLNQEKCVKEKLLAKISIWNNYQQFILLLKKRFSE